MIKEYRCWRCKKIVTKIYQGMCFNCYAEKTNSEVDRDDESSKVKRRETIRMWNRRTNENRG